MRKINKILSLLEKICLVIASIAVALMMILTTVDVALRHLVHSSIPGCLEFVEEIGMPYAIFLTMSFVFYLDGHVMVDLFQRFFSKKVLYLTGIINALVTLAVFVVLLMASWESLMDAIAFNKLSNSVWAYPIAPSYAVVVVGCVMMILRGLQNLALRFQGKNFKVLNAEEAKALDELKITEELVGEAE